MHRDGYGFVVPNPDQRATIEGDIFIPPPAIGSAMHGDQVLVELGRKKEDGRAEGRILRVLTRGNPTVVGTFHRGPKTKLRHSHRRKSSAGHHHPEGDGVARWRRH